MIKSMTGYANGEFEFLSKKILVEVKTVNHRFCEVNVRLPGRYAVIEPEIIEFVRQLIQRGRVDLFIREVGTFQKGKIKIDFNQLDQYLKVISDIQKKTGFKEPPRPETLLTLPQVIVTEEEEIDPKKLVEVLKKQLVPIFKKVDELRLKEGSAIEKDFSKRLKSIILELRKIEKRLPHRLKDYQNRLKDRIQKLGISEELEPWRLAQEVAYWVDRTDISEEVQRLKTHLDHFAEVIKSKETASGRKLDFILQEMNREVNTLGSKAQDAAISESVVCCKHELEKLREQVQNIE